MALKKLEIVSLLGLVFTASVACVSSPPDLRSEQSEAARCPAGLGSCASLFVDAKKPPQAPADRVVSRLEAIEKELSPLEERLDKGDIELNFERQQAVVNAFASDNVRSSALQLQELFLTWAQIFKDKENEKARELMLARYEELKNFEGAIGDYQRIQETKERTQDSKVLAGSDPGVIEEIKTSAGRVAAETLVRKLRELKWYPDFAERIQEIKAEAKEFQLKDLKKDQRAYVKAMGKRVELMIKDIEAVRKLVHKGHYTENELDNGLHYFRRRLREMSLMFGNSDGIFKFTRDGLTDQQRAELAKFEPYRRIDWENFPSFDNAVWFPIYYVKKLEYLVGKVGELKDFKEAQLDTAERIARREMARRSGQKIKSSEERRIKEAAEDLAFDAMVEFFTAKNANNATKRPGKAMLIPDKRNPSTSIEHQAQAFYDDVVEGSFLTDLLKELGRVHKILKKDQ